MLLIDKLSGKPVYEQIIEGIEKNILMGIYEPGGVLPSLRELSVVLGINPNTIQRAYRELEMGGWIATVTGKGCFVCGVPSEAQPELLQLYKRFDDTVEALQMLGISRRELVERLQGGKRNA